MHCEKSAQKSDGVPEAMLVVHWWDRGSLRRRAQGHMIFLALLMYLRVLIRGVSSSVSLWPVVRLL
jgi:hypothetical protein